MTPGSRWAMGSAIGVLAVVAAAAVAPGLFAVADPLATDVSQTLSAPSVAHPFGTDQSGRDVYSRVVHGAALSLGVGLLASAAAVLAGLVIGTATAVAPSWVDRVVMRIVDLMLAVPEFLCALVVVAVLGPGQPNLILGIALAATPVYVRLARGHARTVLATDYVEASRLLGVPEAIVLMRHVLPGVLRRLSVLATIGIGTAILAASGLSFLGLGVSEPTPEWGLMLAGGRNVLGTAWWVAVFPGLAITLTVVSASTLGRVLRTRVERDAA